LTQIKEKKTFQRVKHVNRKRWKRATRKAKRESFIFKESHLQFKKRFQIVLNIELNYIYIEVLNGLKKKADMLGAGVLPVA
jgi:hypothetical protein